MGLSMSSTDKRGSLGILPILSLLLLALLLSHLFVEGIGTSVPERGGSVVASTLQPERPATDWDGHAQSGSSPVSCSLCHFFVTLPAPLFAVALAVVGVRWRGAPLPSPRFALSPLVPPPR